MLCFHLRAAEMSECWHLPSLALASIKWTLREGWSCGLLHALRYKCSQEDAFIPWMVKQFFPKRSPSPFPNAFLLNTYCYLHSSLSSHTTSLVSEVFLHQLGIWSWIALNLIHGILNKEMLFPKVDGYVPCLMSISLTWKFVPCGREPGRCPETIAYNISSGCYKRWYPHH